MYVFYRQKSELKAIRAFGVCIIINSHLKNTSLAGCPVDYTLLLFYYIFILSIFA